jgi:hypothetical protein
MWEHRVELGKKRAELGALVNICERAELGDVGRRLSWKKDWAGGGTMRNPRRRSTKRCHVEREAKEWVMMGPAEGYIMIFN